MRITIGSGNNRKTVSVASGKAYRDSHHAERTRFCRQFNQLAGVKASKA